MPSVLSEDNEEARVLEPPLGARWRPTPAKMSERKRLAERLSQALPYIQLVAHERRGETSAPVAANPSCISLGGLRQGTGGEDAFPRC
jgi:hypothetical protein